MTAFDNMRALLSCCSLEAFAHKRDANIKRVATNATAAEALQLMAEANVLSLPVVDSTTGEFAGVFSVNDALRHLIEQLGLARGQREVQERDVVHAMRTLGARTVEGLMHNGNLWYVRGQEPSVLDALRDMTNENGVHHRLFVCRSLGDTKPRGIVSQSDIVQLMYEHRVEFGDLLTHTVEQLGLCSAAAETVPATEPTIQVLLAMYRDRKSSMGVTDPASGELIGNLSASDLRYVTPALCPVLMAPVGEFILKMRGKDVPTGNNVDWKAALAKVPLAIITPQTSLEDLLRTLTEHRLHRVYVRDNVEGALGIITLTDIMRPLSPPRITEMPTEGPAGGLPAGEDALDDGMEPLQEEIRAA